MSRLSTRLPDFRVATMGERPARPVGALFFCTIERRTGGGLTLGRGRTLARAIGEAVELAEERR